MVDIIHKVQVDVYPSDWMYIHQSEDWGRTKITISIDPRLVETIDWVKNYKKQLEDEAKIRAENPAASSAYDQYQAIIKLVKSDHL